MMIRTSIKRHRDIFDSSPASSTPPQRAKLSDLPPSDASSFFPSPSRDHIPSDSPSNPFGRFKPFVPRSLPRPTSTSQHITLRFQLGQSRRNVYRVVTVPSNYTFWHLAKLTQFLFGWKDTRKERSARDKHRKIERKVDHLFTLQKRVTFYPGGKNPGLFKGGTTHLRVASNVKELRPLCQESEVPWEREEIFTLHHLWHRPNSASDLSRAVIYEYDVLSTRKESVYISLSADLDKHQLPFLASIASYHSDALAESSNTPYVLQGQGLADDDDDDEDFPLDLQQWNESGVFEAYIFKREDEDGEDEDADENELTVKMRLEREQDAVRRRMKAPLPKRLPVDEDPHPEDEDDAPCRFQIANQAQPKANVNAKVPAPVLGKPSTVLGKKLVSEDEAENFYDEEGEDEVDEIPEEDEDIENRVPVTRAMVNSKTGVSLAKGRSPLKKRRSNLSESESQIDDDHIANIKGKGKLVFPKLSTSNIMARVKAKSNPFRSSNVRSSNPNPFASSKRRSLSEIAQSDEEEEEEEGDEEEVEADAQNSDVEEEQEQEVDQLDSEDEL